jgi:hypothetical protein
MLLTGFFDGLGQALGTVIRWIVDSLSGAFGLLYRGVRAFMRSSFIAGSLLLLLGLWLLSMLII